MKFIKKLTILSIIVLTLEAEYIYFFQEPAKNDILAGSQKILSSLKEKVQETSIADLISQKPLESIFHYNSNLEISAWIAYWDIKRGFNTAQENKEEIDSVSPVWFYTNADGSISKRNPSTYEEYVEKIHNNNQKIIPTITNSSAEELSQIINNEKILEFHIDQITALAQDYNFDGIDIDYENLNGEDKESFSNFIKILGQKLHEKNKLLTIAVLPKTDNLIYQFSQSRQAQDWEEIGEAVDEFRIMGYDWTHNSTTNAGAISPVYWLEEILEYALEKVDRNKIVLGLPLYGYYWKGNNVSALTWEDAKELEQSGTKEFDTLTQENKIVTDQGEAWYQDAESIKLRINLAKEKGIKGVVFWRLGGEDPNIWKLE